MSTRKRPPNAKTTTAPTPLTPEQIRDRIDELQAIGVKHHHALAAKHPERSSLSGGLWYAADFLPDDLKVEWETLKKKAA